MSPNLNLLAVRSLAGLGPVRRWVALGARLLVLAAAVLLVAVPRWERENKLLETIVIRDISESTQNVRSFPGKTLQQSIDDWLRLAADPKKKPPNDRVGVISFASQATIDAVPNTTPTES